MGKGPYRRPDKPAAPPAETRTPGGIPFTLTVVPAQIVRKKKRVAERQPPPVPPPPPPREIAWRVNVPPARSHWIEDPAHRAIRLELLPKLREDRDDLRRTGAIDRHVWWSSEFSDEFSSTPAHVGLRYSFASPEAMNAALDRVAAEASRLQTEIAELCRDVARRPQPEPMWTLVWRALSRAWRP